VRLLGEVLVNAIAVPRHRSQPRSHRTGHAIVLPSQAAVRFLRWL